MVRTVFPTASNTTLWGCFVSLRQRMGLFTIDTSHFGRKPVAVMITSWPWSKFGSGMVDPVVVELAGVVVDPPGCVPDPLGIADEEPPQAAAQSSAAQARPNPIRRSPPLTASPAAPATGTGTGTTRSGAAAGWSPRRRPPAATCGTRGP